jgi:hypothetical protein
MDRPCSRPQRPSESDGASKDRSSTSNVPDDKRCGRQHIGIDTGKHTLHLIGLDEQGMIVFAAEIARKPRSWEKIRLAARAEADIDNRIDDELPLLVANPDDRPNFQPPRPSAY